MNKLTWNDIIDILQITVPFITAVLLAYINLKSNENTKKKETLDKRFYNFYFPFFQKYTSLSLYTHEFELSSMDLEIIESFIFLCIDNMYLMDTTSQKYVPDLYKAYLALIEIKHDKSYILVNDTQEHKKFDKIFNNLTKSVLAEYRCICNKLKLPKPTL